MEAETIEEKLTFTCPECSARLKVPIRLAGVTGPCPKCGGTITAPDRSEPPGESSSPKAFSSLRGSPSRPKLQPQDPAPKPNGGGSPLPGEDPAPTPSRPEANPVGSVPAEADREEPESPPPLSASPASPGAGTAVPNFTGIPRSPQSTLFMPPSQPLTSRPEPISSPAPERPADPRPDERDPASGSAPEPAETPVDRAPESDPPAAEPRTEIKSLRPEPAKTEPASLPRPRKLTPPPEFARAGAAAAATERSEPPAEKISSPAEPASLEKNEGDARPPVERKGEPAPIGKPRRSIQSAKREAAAAAASSQLTASPETKTVRETEGETKAKDSGSPPAEESGEAPAADARPGPVDSGSPVESEPEEQQAPLPAASITMPHFADPGGLTALERKTEKSIAPAPVASPKTPPPKNGSLPDAGPAPREAGPVLLPEPDTDPVGVAHRKSLFTIKADEADAASPSEEVSASPLVSGPPISHLDSVLPENSVFTPRPAPETAPPPASGNRAPAPVPLNPIAARDASATAAANAAITPALPPDSDPESSIDVEALFSTPEPKTSFRKKKKPRLGMARFLVTAVAVIIAGLSLAFVGEMFGAWSLFGGDGGVGEVGDPKGKGKGKRAVAGNGGRSPDSGANDSQSTRNTPPPIPAKSDTPPETGSGDGPGSGAVAETPENPGGAPVIGNATSTGSGPGEISDPEAAPGTTENPDGIHSAATANRPETLVFPVIRQLPDIDIAEEAIDVFASGDGGATAVESVGGERTEVIGPPRPETGGENSGADPSTPGEATAVPGPGSPDSAATSSNEYEVLTAIGDGAPPVEAETAAPPNEAAPAVPTNEVEAMRNQENSAVAAAAAAAAVPPVGNVSERAPDVLDEPRAAIERFLQAPNWQDRLPHIYEGEMLRDEISAYYQSHPYKPVSDYHLQLIEMAAQPKGGEFPLYVFYLKLADRESSFPITVRGLPDGMKIDWRSYVEFHDREFGKFLESGQSGPGVYRVILERKSYWEHDRNQMSGYLSYWIESPDLESSEYAFVPANTALSARMEEYFSWGVGAIATTVEVEKKTLPHGESRYLINRLITDPEATDGWHIKPGAE